METPTNFLGKCISSHSSHLQQSNVQPTARYNIPLTLFELDQPSDICLSAPQTFLVYLAAILSVLLLSIVTFLSLILNTIAHMSKLTFNSVNEKFTTSQELEQPHEHVEIKKIAVKILCRLSAIAVLPLALIAGITLAIGYSLPISAELVKDMEDCENDTRRKILRSLLDKPYLHLPTFTNCYPATQPPLHQPELITQVLNALSKLKIKEHQPSDKSQIRSTYYPVIIV